MNHDFDHLHTERLCLRRPAAADAQAVQRIQGDPATNAYNPNGPATPEQAAAMLAAWIADWDRDGIGYWTVAQGCGEPVIGVAGVRRTGEAEAGRAVLNLYYRFGPSAWGKGFAREAGTAAIEAAEARAEPGLVLALICEDNTPSVRVATALGLAPDGASDHHGSERLRFVRAVAGAGSAGAGAGGAAGAGGTASVGDAAQVAS